MLPGHVPLMAALKPGVLSYKAKDHVGVVAIGQGSCRSLPSRGSDTAHDRVLVLVDQALVAQDVDKAVAARDLATADKELAAWKAELDGAYDALLIRRGWAQARLDVAGRATPAH